MKRKKWIAWIVAAACLLALAGCGRGAQADAKRDESLQKVYDAGQLVLGLDLEFPPMGFVDETGAVVGFDIDVAQEVCNRLGVALVTQGINWDAKEDALSGGTIDCIWNGLSVTPRRAETMALSEPYMKNELIFVILSDSDVKGMNDLRGRTIGVQAGSTAQDVLTASTYGANASVVLFEDCQALLRQLERGEIDVALVDSVAAYYFIFSSDRQFFILPDSLGEEEYAIGFRKDDLALRDKIQEIIREMKTDGTLGRISQKWFGSDITIVR